MNSDREPINPPAASPPSYTESQKEHVKPDHGTPPPYSPNPVPNPSIVIERTGPGYQRFDVIEGQPQVVSIFHLGPSPCVVICPACGHQVMTIVHPVPGTITWITACLFFFFCILCTFLPFCIPELQDVAHECPLCHREIGIYSRI